MKWVTGFIVTLAAVLSHAQANNCNVISLEKEARDFLVAKDVYNVRFIQPCLEEAIKRDLTQRKIERDLVQERLSVLNVLAEIKHEKMAALIKCETTGTPGCIQDEGDSTAATRTQVEPFAQITADEAATLDADADAKRTDVERQRQEGSRDW